MSVTLTVVGRPCTVEVKEKTVDVVTVEVKDKTPRPKAELKINRITHMSPAPTAAANARLAMIIRNATEVDSKERENNEPNAVSIQPKDSWGGKGAVPFSARTRLFCYEEMLASMAGEAGSYQQTAVFHQGNNVQTVIRALTNGRSWKAVLSEVVPFPTVSTVSLLWKQSAQGIKWEELTEGSHVVNHFRFASEICTKGKLLRNMMAFFRPKTGISPFMHLPLSFLIGDTTQKTDMKKFAKIQASMALTGEKYERLEREHGAYSAHAKKNNNFTVEGYYVPATFGFNTWIAKPQSLSRGRGIHVFNSIDELNKIIADGASKKHQTSRLRWSWIDRPSDEGSVIREKIKRKKRLGYETDSSDELTSPRKDPTSDISGPRWVSGGSSSTASTASTNPQRSSSTSPSSRCKGYYKVLDKTNSSDLPVTSWIIQKYIERPMLISGRKFDIRVWVVVTPSLHVYFCNEGYVRTAASKYNLNPNSLGDAFMHLCNNAIQKFGKEYAKYEDGNQLGFAKFQSYLDETNAYKNLSVVNTLVPRMKELVRLSMQSVRHHFLRPPSSSGIFKQVSFQLFGYDFMLDDEGETFLIEVNSNPCLEESSALLKNLIPKMLDEMFTVCLRPFKSGELDLLELIACLKTNQVFQNGSMVESHAGIRSASPLRRPSSASPLRRSNDGSVPNLENLPGASGSPTRNSIPPSMQGLVRSRKIVLSDRRCPRCCR